MIAGTIDKRGHCCAKTASRLTDVVTGRRVQYSLLRASWSSPNERYTAAVFGDNLLREKYRTGVVPSDLGGFYYSRLLLTWGVRFSVSFETGGPA